MLFAEGYVARGRSIRGRGRYARIDLGAPHSSAEAQGAQTVLVDNNCTDSLQR